MSAWTEDQLDVLGRTAEVSVITARPDGSERRPVPIWVVRVGGDIYVRSYRGENGAWYRHARANGTGRVEVAGLERDVTFEAVTGPEPAKAIDAAYRTKYARYGDTYVKPMVAPAAQTATLRLTPNDHEQQGEQT